MADKLTWIGPVRVVDDYELSQLTSEGWVLISSHEVETSTLINEDLVRPEHIKPGNDHYGRRNEEGTVRTSRSVLERHRRFLVGLGADENAAKIATRMAALEVQVSEANRMLRDASENSDREFKRAEEAIKNAAAQRKDLDELRAGADVREKRLRAMKLDLARVRKAVGERQWTEILDEGKTDGG